MDPLTHGLLGATIGQAGFARRLGGRARWWGAFGCMLPDVDIVMVPFLGPLGEWDHHRGLTHALWFGPVLGVLLGLLVWRRARADPGPSTRTWWIGLFALTLVVHPLLDLFTSYGTQLLWPWRRRFAIDAVAIIDPLYTLLLVAALAAGLGRAAGSRLARRAAAAALAASTAYILYGWHLNARVEREARAQLGAGWEVHAYPTLLQPWLRRVVARGPGEVRVAFVTTLAPGPIAWSGFVPDTGPAVEAVRASETGRMFEWFAMGQVAARAFPQAPGTAVEIDDLRYGFPGQPLFGLWGVRGVVGPTGALAGPLEPFRRPRPPGLLGQLWRVTFG